MPSLLPRCTNGVASSVAAEARASGSLTRQVATSSWSSADHCPVSLRRGGWLPVIRKSARMGGLTWTDAEGLGMGVRAQRAERVAARGPPGVSGCRWGVEGEAALAWPGGAPRGAEG